MIVKLARVDTELLYPIRHCSEDTQIDFLTIKMRKTLVEQRVNIVNAIRGSLKALGIRIPNATTVGFTKIARPYLTESHPEILLSMSPVLDILDELKAQIKQLDKTIDQIISAQYNLGHFGQDSDLRRYGENIYLTRNAQNSNGKKGSRAAKRKAVIAVIAVIAVARKLSVLMNNQIHNENFRGDCDC